MPNKVQKNSVEPVPRGVNTITPFYALEETDEFVDFLERAFAADVKSVARSSDDVLRHATVTIGQGSLIVSRGVELHEPRPQAVQLHVPNVDRSFAKAVEAGAEPLESPTDTFYGDRRACVRDEWDNIWWIATPVEKLADDEYEKREEQFHNRMPAQ